MDSLAAAPQPATPATSKPHFGHTKHGHLSVHLHTHDHLRSDTPYQRFNKRVAMSLTNGVGTMTCFWLFCLLALCSLPAVLSAFSAFAGVFPSVLVRASIIALVAWVAQTLIQLVLLPALMVGQNLQNAAADARAAKTFDDTEKIIDGLNLETRGGLSDLYERLHGEIEALHDNPSA